MTIDVLVTGARGVVGAIAVGALRARGHRVRGLDRRPGEHADDLVGDLTDATAVATACRGVQVVVHLGATPERADFVTDLVPNNVVGAWNVWSAATAAGAARIVYASSCRVVHGRRWQGMLRVDEPLFPADGYGLTKEFGERMGAFFAHQHRLPAIAARIGWLPRTADELRRSRAADLYLSWDDCARFVVAAVETAFTGFHALFVVGAAAADRYDLAPGRALIGWEPKDVWPNGTPLTP